MSASAIEDQFVKFVKEYQDINGTHVHVYEKPPTALEFLRTSVHANRPALIKGAFSHWPANERWTNDYLRAKMGDCSVTVATTPNGLADSVVYDPKTDTEYFAMPYEQSMPFNRFLDIMERQVQTELAHYISLQNGSLHTEFTPIMDDVDPEISWCSEALGKSPDAVNFWFGDSRSTTSLHKDPYENCYAVIRGTKTFILMPPSEYYCTHESVYPNAIFTPNATLPNQLDLVPLDPPSCTPWIPVDPLRPDLVRFPRFQHAKPIRITVHEGEMLYLPALWLHHVSQDGDQGVISVNYWYDLDYTNGMYPMTNLFRGLIGGVVDGHRMLLRIEQDDSDDE